MRADPDAHGAGTHAHQLKEEKEWLREHNRRCLHSLEDLLQDDKRALKWLRREAERPIGVAPAGPGGVIIDWGE